MKIIFIDLETFNPEPKAIDEPGRNLTLRSVER